MNYPYRHGVVDLIWLKYFAIDEILRYRQCFVAMKVTNEPD